MAILDLLLAVALAAPLEDARIEITHVPAYGSGELLRGRVTNVDPATRHVAGYLLAEGLGWWVKPTAASPCTPVGADGQFAINMSTGGVDPLASRYAVFLLPQAEPCPVLGAAGVLPDSLLASPADFAERTPFTLSFSGHLWVKRNSPYPGGPSGNCFSPDHAFLDGSNQLHLRLAPVAPQGSCTALRGAEVWLARSLGYGEYRVHTLGRVDALDPAAVFGVFTWDPISGASNREMDVEMSRWCVPADPNAQFVVQPFDLPGHRQRFAIALTDDASALTFLLNWTPGRAVLSAYRGHHFGVPPPADLIFEHAFTDGVPQAGRERFRMNLWRQCNLNGAQEVVVTYFRHTGAPERFYTVAPCRAVDTRTSASPLPANTSRAFSVGGTCGVPPDARAVSANVVAVNPGELGDLRLYPTGDATVPVASTLNFAAGKTRANHTVAALGADGKLSVRCDMAAGSSASTHVVLDVFGYFK